MSLKPVLTSLRTLSSLALFLAVPLKAEVKLPSLLADHMVIQRGLPVHVWGTADAGEKVTVVFRGTQVSGTADKLGRWSVYLSPCEAGGPFQMAVMGGDPKTAITLNDVLVGDVWLASGQSNMERPMYLTANAESEIAAAKYPQIRNIKVEHGTSDFPQADAKTRTWAEYTPELTRHASAVAYYFAREIQQKTGVPIGIVESHWGGTAAEAWTSLHTLSSDAALMPVFASRSNAADKEAEVRMLIAQETRAFEAASARAKAEGKPEPPPSPWHPDFANWAPASLYNAMIAPLTNLPIKGVIWYQGESNTGLDRGPLYSRLFPAMIKDWRRAWGIGDFPFLYVQIANWGADNMECWPHVREAQRQTLSTARTAMAVTIDIGETADIHPKNKLDVGKRLALAARAVAYGEAIEYSGPLFRQVTNQEGSLRVWFDHASGLMAKKGEPRSFEVAGSDRIFRPAKARIEGETVVVSSPEVTEPRFVRYGWAANPDCNLYNKEGLPASPFLSAE